MRATTSAIGIALSSLLLAGCGGDTPPAPEESAPTSLPEQTSQTARTSDTVPQSLQVSEAFTTWSDGATAVTYDEEAVPEGSTIEVSVVPSESSTDVTLAVTGLVPDREYGAHVHTGACGADPADAGPHYQNDVDPEQPSTDPAYANPENEVWLDFRTDDDGNATSDTSVPWAPRPGEANSVVIHAESTQTGPGHAGMAGDRLACVNVPL